MATKSQDYKYVKDTYGVPASTGCPVRVQNRPGVITEAKGHYIGVTFKGDKKSSPCHPTWSIEYLDAEGKTIWPKAKK